MQREDLFKAALHISCILLKVNGLIIVVHVVVVSQVRVRDIVMLRLVRSVDAVLPRESLINLWVAGKHRWLHSVILPLMVVKLIYTLRWQGLLKLLLKMLIIDDAEPILVHRKASPSLFTLGLSQHLSSHPRIVLRLLLIHISIYKHSSVRIKTVISKRHH